MRPKRVPNLLQKSPHPAREQNHGHAVATYAGFSGNVFYNTDCINLSDGVQLRRRENPDPAGFSDDDAGGMAFSRRSARHSPFGPSRQVPPQTRSEEHTSELQSLLRISYAVLRLTTTNNTMNIIEPHEMIYYLVT